jgi:hypothetical protein
VKVMAVTLYRNGLWCRGVMRWELLYSPSRNKMDKGVCHLPVGGLHCCKRERKSEGEREKEEAVRSGFTITIVLHRTSRPVIYLRCLYCAFSLSPASSLTSLFRAPLHLLLAFVFPQTLSSSFSIPPRISSSLLSSPFLSLPLPSSLHSIPLRLYWLKSAEAPCLCTGLEFPNIKVGTYLSPLPLLFLCSASVHTHSHRMSITLSNLSSLLRHCWFDLIDSNLLSYQLDSSHDV